MNAQLTSTLVPKTGRARYPSVLAIDLTGNGFSHVVPGGGATAAALRFRLFGRAGTPLGAAVGAATLQSAITTLWLVAAFLVGLIAAVPQSRTRPFLETASGMVIVLLVTFGGLVVPALVSFGIPQDAALLGVLTWRLFQFWIPIPVALLTYLWLRFTRHR